MTDVAQAEMLVRDAIEAQHREEMRAKDAQIAQLKSLVEEGRNWQRFEASVPGSAESMQEADDE